MVDASSTERSKERLRQLRTARANSTDANSPTLKPKGDSLIRIGSVDMLKVDSSIFSKQVDSNRTPPQRNKYTSNFMANDKHMTHKVQNTEMTLQNVRLKNRSMQSVNLDLVDHVYESVESIQKSDSKKSIRKVAEISNPVLFNNKLYGFAGMIQKNKGISRLRNQSPAQKESELNEDLKLTYQLYSPKKTRVAKGTKIRAKIVKNSSPYREAQRRMKFNERNRSILAQQSNQGREKQLVSAKEKSVSVERERESSLPPKNQV